MNKFPIFCNKYQGFVNEITDKIGIKFLFFKKLTIENVCENIEKL